METVPVIANYFHVSIDELFGYENEREERIERILRCVSEFTDDAEKINENIRCLRDSVAEFPAEGRLWAHLGWMLLKSGFKEPGIYKILDKDGGVSKYDTVHNSENPLLKEALWAWEKALELGIPEPDETKILPQMISGYSMIGEAEKAVTLAEDRSSIISSREMLLQRATDGVDRTSREEEALVALMYSLTETVLQFSYDRNEFDTEPFIVDFLRDTAEYCERILGDGFYGALHLKLALLWESCMLCTDPESENAVYFAEKYLYHIHRIDCDVKFTSPLTSKAVPGEYLLHTGKMTDIMTDRFKRRAPTSLVEKLNL